MEEEDVSEDEDNVGINSEYEREFKDELAPEGAQQHTCMSKNGQIVCDLFPQWESWSRNG